MKRRFTSIDTILTKKLYGTPKAFSKVMIFVSQLGKPIVIMLLCGLLALLAYFYNQIQIGIGFGLCLVALGFGGAMKMLLRRQRPASIYVSTMRIQSFSFPSGHALGTLVFYGYVIALALSFAPIPVGVISLLVFGPLILLTGLARVYLGAHYVSDVLGGWLFGAIALAIIIQVIYL